MIIIIIFITNLKIIKIENHKMDTNLSNSINIILQNMILRFFMKIIILNMIQRNSFMIVNDSFSDNNRDFCVDNVSNMIRKNNNLKNEIRILENNNLKLKNIFKIY